MKRIVILIFALVVVCNSYADKVEQDLCKYISQKKYVKALKLLERINHISDDACVLLGDLEAFIDYASDNATSYETYLKLWYWYASELVVFGDMASLSPDNYEDAEYYYSNAAEIYKTLESDTSTLYVQQLRQLMELYSNSGELEKRPSF